MAADVANMIVQCAKELNVAEYQLDIRFSRRAYPYHEHTVPFIVKSSSSVEITVNQAHFKFKTHDAQGASSVLRVAYSQLPFSASSAHTVKVRGAAPFHPLTPPTTIHSTCIQIIVIYPHVHTPHVCKSLFLRHSVVGCGSIGWKERPIQGMILERHSPDTPHTSHSVGGGGPVHLVSVVVSVPAPYRSYSSMSSSSYI